MEKKSALLLKKNSKDPFSTACLYEEDISLRVRDCSRTDKKSIMRAERKMYRHCYNFERLAFYFPNLTQNSITFPLWPSPHFFYPIPTTQNYFLPHG